MSLYDYTVSVYRQMLGAQIALVDKAAAFCAQENLAENVLLRERLIEDMRPLHFQWENVAFHSAGAISGVLGQPPERVGAETLAAIKALLSDADAALAGVRPDDLAAREDQPLSLQVRADRTLTFATGRDFLTSFAMPNFMFHAATAYDILRKRGLNIGKRDFMGAVRMTAA